MAGRDRDPVSRYRTRLPALHPSTLRRARFCGVCRRDEGHPRRTVLRDMTQLQIVEAQCDIRAIRVLRNGAPQQAEILSLRIVRRADASVPALIEEQVGAARS